MVRIFPVPRRASPPAPSPSGWSPVRASSLLVRWGSAQPRLPAQAQSLGPDGGIGYLVGKRTLGHPSLPARVVVVVLLRLN